MIDMKYGRKDATTPQCCVDEGNLPAGNAPFPDADTPQVCRGVHSCEKRGRSRTARLSRDVCMVVTMAGFFLLFRTTRELCVAAVAGASYSVAGRRLRGGGMLLKTCPASFVSLLGEGAPCGVLG